MELNELIEKLEEAQGQATEGEWRREKHKLLQTNGLYRASADRFADAQAIATRHNTAGDVLEALRNLGQLLKSQDTPWVP